MGLSSANSVISGFSRTTHAAWAVYPVVRSHLPVFFSVIVGLQYRGSRGDVYNILWILVFGFATINILSLVARRLDPNRSRLNFGELLAILVVFVSIFLLGWEMLYLFKILPIKLAPR